MKNSKEKTLRISIPFALLLLLVGYANAMPIRITQNFNDNWEFYWADTIDTDFASIEDANWEAVQLPHDWSIGMEYTRENTAGCTGFLPGGIGWYRKKFTMPESAKDKNTWIEFGGIYRDSKIWLNGKYIGGRPYGYSSFKLDLNEHLNYGGENEIIVKVNRKAYMDSRWYPGSGIYRNVHLVTTSPVHIAHWGTFVTTPQISKESSSVNIETIIINEGAIPIAASIIQKITDTEGKIINTHTEEVQLVVGGNPVSQTLRITNPSLWSVDDPNLYTMLTSIEIDGKISDEYTTTFGIRSIRFDPNQGFFLNGVNMKMKGVCLHSDGGAVGTAVPIEVWERRLKILKEAGVNAIRTAHNPAAPDFMDLCDRMGFLVQAEAFDEWSANKNKWIENKKDAWKVDYGELEYGYAAIYDEWAERDLKDMIRRDRNHPSVIMWSIGNEIEWTFPYYWKTAISNQGDHNKVLRETSGGNLELVKIARQLHQWIKEVDTTRPTTAGEVLPVAGNLTGYSDAVDVTGYNYQPHHYDSHHKEFPNRIIYGSENFPQWHEWKECLDRDFISAVFLWPGISYLGEANMFPQKALAGGLLDLAGFKNPVYYLFKTFWQDEPLVYFATQPLSSSHYIIRNDSLVENPENKRDTKWGWPAIRSHWNYNKGDSIYVESYTNAEELELFLNDKSLGKQYLKDNTDRILKWVVPYEEGELKGVARTNGKVIANYSLGTSGAPEMIKLKVTKTPITSNVGEVVHIIVQLCDSKGKPVRHTEKEILLKVKGKASILGVDNGSAYSVQSFQSDRCLTDEGKCLVILRMEEDAGGIELEASLEDGYTAKITLENN